VDINQWSPTRRGFMVAASAAGALAAGRLRHPRIAWAEGGDAREIPGTFMGIPGFPHVADPSPGNEPATIFDFDGVVAITRILGTGTAHGEAPSTMTFDCDMRFMTGRYIGADGTEREGAFGFV
jgi:hypothetical protein